MGKISIRANSQVKTTLLTATAANQKPSCSTQRRQPRRPVYMISALPWTLSGYAETVGRRLGFFDHTGFYV